VSARTCKAYCGSIVNERRVQESHWQEFVRAARKRASGRQSFGRRGACCSSASCWSQAGIRPTRETVERLAAAIQFSMAHGGKDFLVLTVPDIGKAPAFESEGPVASVIRLFIALQIAAGRNGTSRSDATSSSRPNDCT